MHLVAAGLSFRSAPVAVRERAVVSDSEAHHLLRYLVGHCGLRGAAVLSTCNRTEFYVSCPTVELAEDVRPRLSLYLDPAGEGAVGEHLFELRDAEAIRHMVRVAAGLESMVVGEAQVLGQFRTAHRMAREAGTLDAQLDFVMRRAVSAGKRVRTDTAVGKGAGSMADAAVETVAEIAGDLRGRGVLLLGAGPMSALSARRLEIAGARVLVVSRGGESAALLAAGVGGSAVPAVATVEAAGAADALICSTDSADPVLTAADVAAIQAVRQHRPLTIVDIAVPRDVDAAAAAVPGVTLVDVDAVGARVALAHRLQRAALAEATTIVEGEVAHAITLIGERDTAAPTIAALVQRAEAIRRRELERTLARMEGVDAATTERISALTRSIVAKLLHAPIAHLRESAGDSAVALSLRDAFDLDAPETAEDGEASSSAAAS